MNVKGLFSALERNLAGLELPDRTRAAVDAAKGKLTELTRALKTERMPSPDAVRAQLPKLALAVPHAEAPRVSIVIPVYRHFEYTWACLASIAATPQTTPFEVIVVDDASGDETGELLAKVTGIRVVTQPKNGGFIASCNAGAAVARGELVCFLNNDTRVLPGWLDELTSTFEREPTAGLVGAQLIYPDGSLQEAGGIVFRDGSGANYGRGGDRDRCDVNYLREVDYCSGACIVVPRALFESLGGFDAHYTPAYYEDTDLAFRIRAAGHEVLYQPLARVVHFEGVSSGTDVNSGVKRHQVTNREKFFARWRETLAHHGNSGRAQALEKDRGARKRLLVVDTIIPRPDHDSGSLRMHAILLLARKVGFKVTLAPCEISPDSEPYIRDLQRQGVEVLHRPYFVSVRQALRELGPTSDAILISRVDNVSRFLDAARRHAPRARIWFDTVDLHWLREESEARLRDDATLAERARARKQQEIWAAEHADVTLVVSDREKTALAAAAPSAEVVVVSNIHREHAAAAGFAQRRDLLFIGGYKHPPNVDAALWLAREIFPRVRDRLPGAKLLLVGSEPPEEVRALAEDDVVVTGQVADLGPLMERTRVSIAPLRFGAGVKGKINTAMSYGVPVVSTTVGVEGMSLSDGVDVLVADDAEGLAEAIVRLHRDEALWHRLAAEGRRVTRELFSTARAEAVLAQLLAGLTGPDAP